jgi:5-amino-6-(5-phosphoribosylamino)uracil reductase
MTFDEFANRKIAEASAAVLLPYITRFERPPADALEVVNDWSRALFDGPFYESPVPRPHRPACNLVFVQSLDGNTGAADPTALGGGATDKHLVYEGLSRVTADAVMAGAETIRGGDVVFSVWHPQLVPLRAAFGKSRHPIQVVATLRGLDLGRGILFNTPDIPSIVITVAACADVMAEALATRPWIETVVMTQPTDLPRAFEKLRTMGVERLSCVGGRRIAARLIDAGLVDDVYVTTSPRPGGEPHTPMYPRPLPVRREVVTKHGTGVEHGVVFGHYMVR